MQYISNRLSTLNHLRSLALEDGNLSMAKSYDDRIRELDIVLLRLKQE